MTYICQTRKMQVEGLRSWVSRSSNRSREDKDGKREGEGCFGLANTKVL